MQPDPNAVAVARRVREVLDEVGVSANALAQRMGWTQSYIARRMGGGVAFSAADLILISVQLGVAPTRLIPDAPSFTTSAR